jgi:indolepyruvate ferredoxin oxidoreductase alpha subunit
MSRAAAATVSSGPAAMTFLDLNHWIQDMNGIVAVPEPTTDKATPPESTAARLLMGDEAAARGAIDAGISAAYAYPGTPSTEAFAAVLEHNRKTGRPVAAWAVNEKTAYEQALGVSMAGRRALVVMKHVGLNVAADPFINSALVSIQGGLVAVVADDPGMHSSQNEQDSRVYADFARILCLEPRDQQEAYEMSRTAFELSERFQIPVLVRLVTRLAHSRSAVRTAPAELERPAAKTAERQSWILLPENARGMWRRLVEVQRELREWSESCPYNRLEWGQNDRGLGVITTGIAEGYYRQHLPELGFEPSHLHIGAYPLPLGKLRQLASRVGRILVLEEGFPFLEERLRGILPTPVEVHGMLSGHLPETGELTPETVGRALGLPGRTGVELVGEAPPPRPPQLCQGCPHRDTYAALLEALADTPGSIVNADIGCYTLGALPPYSVIESCVCMGAGVGMAKGASDAGLRPAVAVIGDSTFLHSGITPLIDAVQADTDMTLVILDNAAVGMTGAQDTVLPPTRLEPLVLGLGVDPAHCRVLEARPSKVGEITEVLRQELAHPGLSVVITVRECIEHARMRKARARRSP